MSNPPTTLEGKLILIKQKKHLLNDPTAMGEFLRATLDEVKLAHKRAEQEAKRLQPLQFFKPSYEQSLILNSWMYGIGFVCIYSGNRIGKTTVCIINFLLWILPNVPTWRIFQPYEVGGKGDEENHDNPNRGAKVHVFRRPDINTLRLIQETAKRRPPHIPVPNPREPHYTENNRQFLQWLQNTITKRFPRAFKSTFPAPPWSSGGTVWMGGPDHDHFKDIIMPLWRQYVPLSIVERDVESSRNFTFVVPHHNSTVRKTTWEWIGKSYESKDTKWSSGAVDAIILTEGVVPAIWDEVKARFKDPSIGSHDFTPYEPANSGAATALAQRIKKGTEPVPLPHYVFDKFTVYNAPRQVMSAEKQNQLITAYQHTEVGKARLDGEFFSSSALVLSNLDRSIHLLDWTIEELFQRYPTAQLYRGIDPGLDHPTACAWGALLPTNQWVIYRILCQPGLSISQRAEKIVTLSNNTLSKRKYGPRKEDFYLEEIHPNPTSEVFVASPIDFHVFKQDETTGQSYALNYHAAGLTVSESIHTGPEDRANTLNDLLLPSPFVPDPRTNTPDGARVFFLRKSPGILTAFTKWEEYYWDRKRSGDDKGAPKDKVPSHGDDELDAVCYLTSSPFKWTSYRPPAKMGPMDSEPEPSLIQAATRIRESRQAQPTLQRLQNTHTKQQAISFFGDPNSEPEDEDPYKLDRY